MRDSKGYGFDFRNFWCESLKTSMDSRRLKQGWGDWPHAQPQPGGPGFSVTVPSLSHYLKIFTLNVIAVLLCGCETWCGTKNDTTKLDVFLPKKLRRIMKIYWPMKVSNLLNEEIRIWVNISNISEQIYRRCWRFIGHILRLDANQHPEKALT